MNMVAEKESKPRITEAQIKRELKKFDWDAHWKRVIEKVSKEASLFEMARATSRSQVARKVFG